MAPFVNARHLGIKCTAVILICLTFNLFDPCYGNKDDNSDTALQESASYMQYFYALLKVVFTCLLTYVSIKLVEAYCVQPPQQEVNDEGMPSTRLTHTTAISVDSTEQMDMIEVGGNEDCPSGQLVANGQLATSVEESGDEDKIGQQEAEEAMPDSDEEQQQTTVKKQADSKNTGIPLNQLERKTDGMWRRPVRKKDQSAAAISLKNQTVSKRRGKNSPEDEGRHVKKKTAEYISWTRARLPPKTASAKDEAPG